MHAQTADGTWFPVVVSFLFLFLFLFLALLLSLLLILVLVLVCCCARLGWLSQPVHSSTAKYQPLGGLVDILKVLDLVVVGVS